MIDPRNERREGLRLAARRSAAEEFRCPCAAVLPETAVVSDLSEEGARLLFDWPEQVGFPLRAGDALDFRLRVEGAAPGLDLRGVVRRVEPRGRRGRVAIAVQLDPAAPPVRQAFRATLLSRTAPATRMR